MTKSKKPSRGSQTAILKEAVKVFTQKHGRQAMLTILEDYDLKSLAEVETTDLHSRLLLEMLERACESKPFVDSDYEEQNAFLSEEVEVLKKHVFKLASVLQMVLRRASLPAYLLESVNEVHKALDTDQDEDEEES